MNPMPNKQGRPIEDVSKTRPFSVVFRISERENAILDALVKKEFDKGGRGERSEVLRSLILKAAPKP